MARRVATLATAACSVWVIAGCGYDWNAGRPAADGGSDGATGGGACERHQEALFCDDFESGNLDAWTSIGGNPTLTQTKAHDGQYAVGFAAMSTASIRKTFPAVSSGSLFVRAYILQDLDVIDESLTIASLEPSSGEDWYGEVYLLPDGAGMYADWTQANDAENGAALLDDKWQCITWEVNFDLDEFRLYKGDTKVLTLDPGREIDPKNGFGTVTLGIPIAMGQTHAGTIYFDSVVIDDQPIACD